MVFFLSLCEHLWDQPDANFAILQHCHHHFQYLGDNIQLHIQLPGCNSLICKDELTKSLFFLWCDICAHLLRTWFVFHITVATTEMHHLLPHCAHVYWLVSMSVQQAVMNVSTISSAQRNSIPCLCFIYVSLSDTILSD